jgi:hypothetical protein
MKKKLIFILVTIFVAKLYGQEVAIELSIEWRMEKSNLDGELCHSPYLKIRYNNLTYSPIYFAKAYKNKNNLPLFPVATAGFDFDNVNFATIVNSKDSVIKHDVIIGGMSSQNELWEIIPDSIDPYANEERVVDVINDKMSYLYEKILGLRNFYKIGYIDKDSLTENYILKHMKDDFVFLSPNQSQAYYYNLTGFKLIGGSYTFMLLMDKISDYMTVGKTIWDDQKQDRIFEKAKFPDKIKEYKLYSGDFYTNEVSVHF